MVPTMNLPHEMRVTDLSERVQHALEEFAALEPTRYALAHWLTGAYRGTLVTRGNHDWPVVLRVTTEVKSVIAEAKAALGRAREAASSLDGAFIESLPARVHVVRVKDADGQIGFAPIDVRGASLSARALSVLLADYLMRPEAYVDDTCAA